MAVWAVSGYMVPGGADITAMLYRGPRRLRCILLGLLRGALDSVDTYYYSIPLGIPLFKVAVPVARSVRSCFEVLYSLGNFLYLIQLGEVVYREVYSNQAI